MSRGLAVALVITCMSITLTAECLVERDILKKKNQSSFMFEGTVTSVDRLGVYPQDYAVTIDVHRVWKGVVGKEIVVYFRRDIDHPNPPTVGTPKRLKPGESIVWFAKKRAEMSPFLTEGSAPHLDPWLVPCGTSAVVNAKTVKRLGRSRPPSP